MDRHVWGARAVVELLAEAAVMKPDQKTAFAISRKIVNTAIGRDVADALAVYRMRVLAAAFAQRVGSLRPWRPGRRCCRWTRLARPAQRSRN